MSKQLDLTKPINFKDLPNDVLQKMWVAGRVEEVSNTFNTQYYIGFPDVMPNTTPNTKHIVPFITFTMLDDFELNSVPHRGIYKTKLFSTRNSAEEVLFLFKCEMSDYLTDLNNTEHTPIPSHDLSFGGDEEIKKYS